MAAMIWMVFGGPMMTAVGFVLGVPNALLVRGGEGDWSG
jgi:hypothetical protein